MRRRSKMRHQALILAACYAGPLPRGGRCYGHHDAIQPRGDLGDVLVWLSPSRVSPEQDFSSTLGAAESDKIPSLDPGLAVVVVPMTGHDRSANDLSLVTGHAKSIHRKRRPNNGTRSNRHALPVPLHRRCSFEGDRQTHDLEGITLAIQASQEGLPATIIVRARQVQMAGVVISTIKEAADSWVSCVVHGRLPLGIRVNRNIAAKSVIRIVLIVNICHSQRPRRRIDRATTGDPGIAKRLYG